MCMSSIHASSRGKYPILETTAKKPLTELWTCVIISYAVRHSVFPNPYGDQFKPWSVKCDYPCPVFELGGCKERLIALACMSEGKTGTKTKSCFCMSLWGRAEIESSSIYSLRFKYDEIEVLKFSQEGFNEEDRKSVV